MTSTHPSGPIAVAGALLVLASTIGAQQPPGIRLGQRGVRFRAGVDLVRLSVTARDADGQILAGDEALVIAFNSTNREANGRWRTIEVRATRPGVTLATRNGYYAPAPRW